MQALQPLFSVTEIDRTQTHYKIAMHHIGIPLMYIEMHYPEPPEHNGYFSAFWLTVKDNFEGKKALAESYARLRRQFERPIDAEKLLKEYKELYCDEIKLELIFGPNGSSPVNFCGEGPLRFGLKVDSIDEIVKEIQESRVLPDDFSFLRFDSPYGAHYFGTYAFSRGVREVALLTHLNLSQEIVALLRATSYHNIPEEHTPALIAKLDDLFSQLPKPLPKNGLP